MNKQGKVILLATSIYPLYILHFYLEYRDDELIPKLKKVVVARRVIGNVRAL